MTAPSKLGRRTLIASVLVVASCGAAPTTQVPVQDATAQTAWAPEATAQKNKAKLVIVATTIVRPVNQSGVVTLAPLDDGAVAATSVDRVLEIVRAVPELAERFAGEDWKESAEMYAGVVTNATTTDDTGNLIKLKPFVGIMLTGSLSECWVGGPPTSDTTPPSLCSTTVLIDDKTGRAISYSEVAITE